MLYTSIENKKIKEIKKLYQKKYRDLNNRFIVEGEHLVVEAYKKGVLEELLVAALPHFEFPRWQNPFTLDMENKTFSNKLTSTEMMILRSYMIVEWIGFQLATVDLIRQKYSGSDFKFTSQASHIKQLVTLKQEYERKAFHLQRIYCRREIDNQGRVRSTFYKIMDYDPRYKTTSERT